MTDQHKAEVPNMPQRTVMQCLSLDDWKVVAHLPVPVGELMVSRLLEYGWIESQGEEQRKAIRLTPAGLKALRSRGGLKAFRLVVEIGLKDEGKTLISRFAKPFGRASFFLTIRATRRWSSAKPRLLDAAQGAVEPLAPPHPCRSRLNHIGPALYR